MELLILSSFLILALLAGGLLLVDYLERVGADMQERKAIVFEIYRYSICFFMVSVFGFSAFQLGLALILDASTPQALTGPRLGVILSGVIFLVHWFIKNPAAETKAPSSAE